MDRVVSIKRLTSWLWLLVLLAVGWAAYRHRESVVVAFRLVGRADFRWVAVAAVAIAGVYACRAGVYAVPLRLLGYRAPVVFLWATGIAATSLHQLLPAAGATGYAFLTYAFRQRGIPSGQASLVALIDTLAYSASLGVLVIVSLAYLAVRGSLQLGRLGTVLGPGAVALVVGIWIYRRQRDRHRFVAAVLHGKNVLASLVGRHWPDAPIATFFDEYYEGKSLISRRPRAFLKMIGLQFLAVVCDTAALYLAFLAIGLAPNVVQVLIGFVLAMSGAAIVGAPGGGGSFETIISAFWAAHGLTPAQGLAAAVLYRLVAFWLPVAFTAVVLLRLRGRKPPVVATAAQ